jgi:hypothetical protein
MAQMGSDPLAKAKATLASANAFQKSAGGPVARPAPAMPAAKTNDAIKVAPAAPSVNSRAGQISMNKDILAPSPTTLPKMHSGGLVLEDGAKNLEAGESVTPSGRRHPMGEKSEPLMPKAKGANVADVDSRGDHKAMNTAHDGHISTLKPIHLKKKELEHAESDWKGACHGSLCNCNDCK